MINFWHRMAKGGVCRVQPLRLTVTRGKFSGREEMVGRHDGGQVNSQVSHLEERWREGDWSAVDFRQVMEFWVDEQPQKTMMELSGGVTSVKFMRIFIIPIVIALQKFYRLQTGGHFPAQNLSNNVKTQLKIMDEVNDDIYIIKTSFLIGHAFRVFFF